MGDTDTQYIHALRSIEGIGDGTLSRLLLHFESGERAWRASGAEIETVPKLSPAKKSALINGRKRLDPQTLWERLLTQDIACHAKTDPTYPKLLREIPDSPQTLYTRGNFAWDRLPPFIAIVGSRKHSSYGVQVAEQLASDLVRAGIVVVSGMAFGIDSVAHRGAIEAGGETIAVLGGGIDDPMIAPISHFELAHRIMKHGALVSEYPPGTPVAQGSFPMRDRIIAGLCLGTIVIEAPERSGSLITAQCALDYNREVFAVPGSIFSPYSIGTNALIKRGAKMVTGVADILEELQPEVFAALEEHSDLPAARADLSPEEQKIVAVLTHEPLHVDKIIQQTALPTREVSSLLSLLEIKGLAKNVGGMHYVKGQ